MDATRLAVEELLRFVLVATRVSGLFLLAPVLASSGVPRRVKAALAAIVALLVLPVLPAGSRQFAVGAVSARQFAGLIAGELAIGFTIGMVAAVVLAGIELAGLFVGQQTGLALANVLNPLGDDQVSVLGQFYSLFALVIFLVIGGHRMLVSGLMRSFEAVPLGAFRLSGDVAAAVVGHTGRIFTIALTMSAPVVVAMTVAEFALGLLSRTVPQLNILAVGFSIRVGVGWLIMLLSLGAVAVTSKDLFAQMLDDLGELVGLM